MHDNRNERINQISEDTLVIGVDIAKCVHYACAVDERGREVKKSFSFRQSRQGFETFYATILKVMESHQKKNVVVGFEPTGHYWMNLSSYLTDRGIRFVLVNPLHVKQTKELDDNLQSKNDPKDARVIAKMIPQGYYSIPRDMTPIEAELRHGSAFRDRLKKQGASTQNRIKRWIDLYFPEFISVYKSIGMNASTVLSSYPLPEDLVREDPEKLLENLKNLGGKHFSVKNLTKLLDVAATSIGYQESPEMARAEIHILLTQMKLYEEQLESIEKQLVTLAKQMTDFDLFLSVPGIGENTVVKILSEIGAFSHYKSPRQILKLAGLTLVTNSSGKKEGNKRLSKRGRKRLRSLIYKAIFPILHAIPAFRSLYDYYSEHREHPVAKKEALLILCRKLIQVLHGLSKRGETFNEERMVADISFFGNQKAA